MPGILPASTKQSGQCFAFPDTCITPAAPSPIPIPYPNIGMVMQVTKASTKVKFMNNPVVILTSKISRSQGDEAGTNGGVMSGVNMNEVQYKKGSAKVKVEGKPVVCLTSMTGHNGTNSNMPSGMQIAPSQVKVLIAP